MIKSKNVLFSKRLSLRETCPYLAFFGSGFFRIRTEYGEIYGLSLHIQSKCGKMQTSKTPNTDTSHAVCEVTHLSVFLKHMTL